MKGEVPHGTTHKFTLSIDRFYKPKRLVVAPECAAYYEITKVVAGGKDYLLANGATLPGTAFPPLPEVLVAAEEAAKEAEGIHLGEADILVTMRQFSHEVLQMIPKLIALFNKFDFQTLQSGQTLEVTVRHKEKCPVHTDCISMGAMCCDIPFHGWFEGTAAY